MLSTGFEVSIIILILNHRMSSCWIICRLNISILIKTQVNVIGYSTKLTWPWATRLSCNSVDWLDKLKTLTYSNPLTEVMWPKPWKVSKGSIGFTLSSKHTVWEFRKTWTGSDIACSHVHLQYHLYEDPKGLLTVFMFLFVFGFTCQKWFFL